jgi:hypothetical protein
MAGSLQISGGVVSNKQPRYAPLFQGRWYTGLVSQRSPLRSAGSSYVERYIGTQADALIDGSNCEITPKLTLARRPGNSVYNSHSFTAVDYFYAFRMFGPTTESIEVLADTSTGVYIISNNQDTLLYSKPAGAGQTFFQSVGNTLYFGNGETQQKYVQSLFTRTNSAAPLPNIGDNVTLSAASTPFISTYLIDTNGNIEELLATAVTTVSNVAYVESTNTLTLTVGSTAGITVGNNYVVWNFTTATWLNGVTWTVLTSGGGVVTANLLNTQHADYASAADTGNVTDAEGGTPVTGGSVPTWSTQVPSSANDFQGGVTIDGTAVWINRGLPLENWGIAAGTTAPTAVVGTSGIAWKADTFFSLAGVVIDTQFAGQTNIWQVTVVGKSGLTNPFTSNPTSGTTTVTDGGVTWKSVASTFSGDSFWSGSTVFPSDHLIVANASGTPSLFQLQPNPYPTYEQVLGVYITANVYPHNGGGSCELRNPVDGPNNPGVAPYTLTQTATGNSVLFDPNQANGSGTPNPLHWATLTSAGDISGYTTLTSATAGNYNLIAFGTLSIPVAGQYSFTIFHKDGMYWGIGPSAGNQPTVVSGPNNCPAPVATLTALNGYPVMGANNSSGSYQDSFSINFPVAGNYPFEVDFASAFAAPFQQFLGLYCNGQTPVPGTAETGATVPVWPTFSTAFAPNYATASERNNAAMGALSGVNWLPAGSGNGPLSWANLGPITDSVWTASTNYTLPDTTITDPNNNTESPFRAGITGATAPTFATGTNQLTLDNPNLIWINLGPAPAPPPGTLSAFNGGYIYYVALVNSATDTVSNASPASTVTGNFIGAAGVQITGGLPPLANIDPQSDFVAIFRTTDGLTTPFLISGTTNAIWTVPLPDYLVNGYYDDTLDTGLNNLIEGPIAGQNTPPALGSINLAQYLQRIFYSIGNTVYYTSGPDTPVGNGFEGAGPDNFQELPSKVVRLVPTIVGIFIFTVSDIYLIANTGGSIPPAVLYAQGLGLLNYNALDVFGSTIGFFASDSTFDTLDISSGPSETGFNIGNLLQVAPWNPNTAYVTWHSSGEDKAWFLSDGTTGWYRIGVTPSPEQGVTISPFATIVGGAQAVQSIETSPGVHQLLVGPSGSGPILARNLTQFQDNGNNYTWYATVGSIVLVNPGQLAEVAFITTEANAVGTAPSVGVILDEAFPTYTGPFENIADSVNDPPTLPPSTSIYAQRWYLAQTQQPAVCRHLQIQVTFPAEPAKNELWNFCVFGAILQEN